MQTFSAVAALPEPGHPFIQVVRPIPTNATCPLNSEDWRLPARWVSGQALLYRAFRLGRVAHGNPFEALMAGYVVVAALLDGTGREAIVAI